MKAFIFPGQGSQARGMGGALFEEFSALTAKADQVLGYSIKELCLEDPRSELNRTQFTQPALFIVNALSYLKRVSDAGGKPDFVAGHSLGELNALLAAGCFDFETGLRIVQKRGELMSRVSNGAMAAVTNASKEEIEDILRRNGLVNIDLANYNSPSQIVISGDKDEIRRAEPLFQSGKMNFFALNTSGAFHSRFMLETSREFGEYLANIDLAEPALPVIANVTGRPYQAAEVRTNLSKQMVGTVRWSESVQYLLAVAARQGATLEFDEIGHGNVLTKLVAGIRKQTPQSVLDGLMGELAQGYAAAARNGVEAQHAQATSEAPAAPAPSTRATPMEKVAAWNRQFPIGTQVRSLLSGYNALETRTQAVVLFGHRAAIYMKGYNGYFDLDEIAPV